MHKRVMRGTEHEQALKIRLAAVGPMLHVMRIEIARVMTARECARVIAREHGFLQRARDDPLLSSDVEWAARFVVHHRRHCAVAATTGSHHQRHGNTLPLAPQSTRT